MTTWAGRFWVRRDAGLHPEYVRYNPKFSGSCGGVGWLLVYLW